VRSKLTASFTALCLSLVIVPSSAAQESFNGQCRAAVRPLLASTEPDPERLRLARQLCRAEADAGDPLAVYHLSFFHLGLGGWDTAQATDLMFMAAQGGVPEAQYWLAWQYDAGPLLPREYSLALKWYQQAAGNEHPLALYRLAEAYDAGELGLAPDPAKARQLRARAARCANQAG
jgi:TPR repeat protein